MFIVFEGIDGTGKSTQIDLLASSLTDLDLPVITTREPTNGQFGKKIRALYTDRSMVSQEEELELFLADRKEHIDLLLQPELTQGKIILCDRYFLSTIAYQGAAGLDPHMIKEKNSFAPIPDLTLLFTMPASMSRQRITGNRGDTLNDFEQEEYLTRVAALFDKMQEPYIHRINAAPSQAEVHKTVLAAVQPLLNNRYGTLFPAAGQ